MNILHLIAKRKFDFTLGNYLKNYGNVIFVASDPLDYLFFKINSAKTVSACEEIKPGEASTIKPAALKLKRYLNQIECYRLAASEAEKEKIERLFNAYVKLLERLFRENNIQICLAHERDFLDTAAAQCVSENLGTKIFYFSSGFFRGETISVAPERILFTDYEIWEKRIRNFVDTCENTAGRATTTGKIPIGNKQKLQLKKIPRTREYASRLISSVTPSMRERLKYLRPRRSIISSILHQRERKKARTLEVDSVSLEKPFILVPLQGNEILGQVENPFSIGDMEQLSEMVIKAVRKMNEIYRADFQAVIKEHPLRPFVVGDRFAKAHPEAIFLRKYDMDELMEQTSLVVTFNSLSGFEALQRAKPVVMLGPLFYRLKNLVHWPERQEDLPETMWQALHSTVDSKKLKGLLSYLRCNYEVRANRKRLTSRGLYNIASKILA